MKTKVFLFLFEGQRRFRKAKNMTRVHEGEFPETSQGFENVWLVLMPLGSAGWEGGWMTTNSCTRTDFSIGKAP